MPKSIVRTELSTWWLLFFVALLATALGTWGSRLYLLAQAKPAPLADCVYRAIQLFGFNLYDSGPLPWQLEAARWMAPLLTLTSLFAAFSGVLRGHYLSLRVGRLRNHTVLVGQHWSTDICVRGAAPIVFVQTDGDTQPCATENGSISLRARSITEAVSRCALHRSAVVIVEVNTLGEGVCWITALQNACQKNGRLEQDVCLVGNTLDTASGLRALALLAEPQLRIRVIDLSKILFDRCAAWVAEAIASRSAQQLMIKIWLVGDPDYSLEVARQVARQVTLLPGFELQIEICTSPEASLADSSIQTLNDAVTGIRCRQSSMLLSNATEWKGGSVDLVCYCSKHPEDLLLNYGALNKIMQGDDAPLLALAIHGSWPASEAIVSLLGKAAYPKLTLVCGGADQELVSTVQANSAPEQLAKQVHNAYLTTIQDPSAPANQPWDYLPELYRDSSRLQVHSFLFKLACLGYPLKAAIANVESLRTKVESNIEALAEAEHKRWIAERKLQGWTYGRHRDDSAKTHPSLIAYANLSESEKEKDRVMWHQLINFVLTAKQHNLTP